MSLKLFHRQLLSNGLVIATVGPHCLTLGREDEGNPGESQNLRKSRRTFPLARNLNQADDVKMFMGLPVPCFAHFRLLAADHRQK